MLLVDNSKYFVRASRNFIVPTLSTQTSKAVRIIDMATAGAMPSPKQGRPPWSGSPAARLLNESELERQAQRQEQKNQRSQQARQRERNEGSEAGKAASMLGSEGGSGRQHVGCEEEGCW